MDRKTVVTEIWWRCHGDSDSLPELAPCDVLASTPEAAAQEYARGAHEELAPEDIEIITTVYVANLWRPPPLSRWPPSPALTLDDEGTGGYLVTTRRVYLADRAEMEFRVIRVEVER